MKPAWILISAVLATVTGGCSDVTTVGAAAGGYYVGKDERTASQIAEDAAITSRINLNYINDAMVKTFDIDVDTYLGNVVLHGKVGNKAVEERAIALAMSVKGVKQVTSRLVIIPAS